MAIDSMNIHDVYGHGRGPVGILGWVLLVRACRFISATLTTVSSLL